MQHWRQTLLTVGFVVGLSSPAMAQDALFDAQGYRASHYRGPIAHAPEGVPRIAPAAVATLVPDRDALLIDVLPAEGGQRQDDGRWRLAQAHASLPGAHWFPEAGRGTPDPGIAEGFMRGITRLTHGDSERRLVVFCLADCWMSWNAARRLRKMGYTNVWWLAEGTNGWHNLGLPLTPATPER